MFSFLNNFFTHIIGICIGLAVGVLIAFIICLIFKQASNKILLAILTISFAILGAIGGYAIQDKYFISHEDEIPPPTEIVENLNKEIKDGWLNTNGGFTIEQIKKIYDDDDAPIISDQIVDLKCHDFGAYVVFGYKDYNTYYNVLFYKAENGLVLDGVANTTANLNTIFYFPLIKGYDLSSFKWNFEWDKEPYYKVITNFLGSFKYDNIVSLSRQNMKFVTSYADAWTNGAQATRLALENATTLTSQNATTHFIKFNNVELIGSLEDSFIKINSFYNYLYEQVKDYGYNSIKLVDATNCLCAPIPESEQVNYPIPASKKAEYDNAEYYGVYNCSIAVNLTYVEGNKTIGSTKENYNYIKEIELDEEKKDLIKVDDIVPNKNFYKISVNFVDTNNSDITDVDLQNNPVEIVFNHDNSDSSKSVFIKDIQTLKNGVDVLLDKDSDWNYEIYSDALIFEDFRGSFTIKNNSSSLNFEYYYLNNYTILSVGLNSVGTIDENLIDLTSNPVKIILSNDKHTYQFLFDDNSLLNSYQNLLVEMGEYNYTILSEQLIFASVTGKLTVTTTDKVMLFNYALGTDSALKFDIAISNVGTTDKCFMLYSSSLNVSLIRDYLSSAKVYTVTCVIYDEDGKLMETFNHIHSATGSCSDTWYASNLVAGQAYTLQLRFADRDDSTITYLSDITTFTYNSNTTYQINYNVTEV